MTTAKTCAIVAVVLASTALFAQQAAPPYTVFTPVGMGGGGGMFAPASSPHDPDLMFVSCDMGGFYRTENAGVTWEMVDFRQTRGSTSCRPVFHPGDADVLFLMGKISEDRGRTWRALADPPPWGRGRAITCMGIDSDDGRLLLVGTRRDGAFISSDAGATWRNCEGLAGAVVDFLVDPAGPDGARRIFAATEQGVYRSSDSGETWVEKSGGLPWRDIRSFAGGYGSARQHILYCVIPSREIDGEFAGGVFRSTDAGESWQSIMGDGINTRLGKVDEWGHGDIAQYRVVQCGARQAERVYVSNYGTGYWPPNHNTIYRSDDAGETWRFTFNWDMRFDELNVELGWHPFVTVYEGSGPHHRNGFTINRSNPDILLHCAGEFFVSKDGGESWRQRYSRYAPGQPPPVRNNEERRSGRWQSIGLEVTTTWNYHIDPFDHDRHYICYTDIGFAISTDGGKTWWDNTGVSGARWKNTTYDIVFDPDVRGLVWAAMSNVHDIPHSTHVDRGRTGPGGVCVSTDSCASWRVSCEGLPSAPCTSIVLDPTSPAGARTLWVTLYGKGVYRSTDSAKTWQPSSTGLPLDRNSHTFLIKRHPGGALFCSITASREGRSYPTGGLFRSDDGGDTWREITRSRPFHWCNGFDFDPADSDVIYLAACNNHADPEEGGIWKTVDAGDTWRQLLGPDDFAGRSGPESDTLEGMFVTVAPHNSAYIYLGTTAHGLWVSYDSGETWRQFEGIPFAPIHRVTFDPDNPDKAYVTTFGGGVWTGWGL